MTMGEFLSYIPIKNFCVKNIFQSLPEWKTFELEETDFLILLTHFHSLRRDSLDLSLLFYMCILFLFFVNQSLNISKYTVVS